MTYLIAVSLFLQFASGQSAANPAERLKAKVPVTLVRDVRTDRLAGKYKNPSAEVLKQIGGALSGDELYLFPDGTYIYCEWADISPRTVEDKGKWKFNAGLLELTSDPEIIWQTSLEREYVAVYRKSHPEEVLLVGTGRDLAYFEDNAGDDPEFMLLINSKGREKNIKQSKAAKLKAKIMAEARRPDFHKPQGP